MNKVADLSLTQEAKYPKLFWFWSDWKWWQWERCRDTSRWWMGKDFQLNLKDVWLNSTVIREGINWCAYKCSQKLLLYQFPTYQGLHNSLIQQCIGFWVNNYIQIWLCRQCYWITVSSIGCKPEEVRVYNSLYSDPPNVNLKRYLDYLRSL